MDELLEWLRNQHSGVNTYVEFRKRSLALRTGEPESAAAARLLADMAGRLVDAYDAQPFPVDVANRTLHRLTELVGKAAKARASGPSEQLNVLNELGFADLT